jgi:putative ABC transport system substrate-binding protein
MSRRFVLLALLVALLGTSHVWSAAQAPDRPVIGYLCTHTAWVDRFREALAEIGYVDGRNITLVWRGGDDQLGELPKIARQLVDLRVNVIVTDSTTGTLAAKAATSTIPIVFAHVADPVGFGLVTSLAHPGGNITGVTLLTLEVAAKRLQLLKEAVPKLSRIAVLWNPNNPLGKVQVEDAAAGCKQLGLKMQTIAAGEAGDLESAFARLPQSRETGLLVTDDNLFWNQLPRIAALSAKHSLPGIAGTRVFPESAGLFSYGANPKEQYHRAALYVDRILNGAKPASLPVERATKLELVVNLRTAQALGITIPQSILLRADEVIR